MTEKERRERQKGKDPMYQMVEIPNGKHPAWAVEENRVVFEEDIRIHVYDAIENLTRSQMSPEEREHWERVIAELGKLGRYYQRQGFGIHIH